MDIYEFLTLMIDCVGCHFIVYDLRTEEQVFAECEEAEELMYSEWADYQIESFDVYKKDDCVVFEFNIETEEDD